MMAVIVGALALGCSQAKGKAADTAIELELARTRGDSPKLQDTAITQHPVVVAGAPETSKPRAVTAVRQAPAVPSPKEPAVVQAATPLPEPAAPPPRPEIPAATQVTARFGAQVCDSKLKAGDEIAATLDQSIDGINGAQLSAGTRIVFIVNEIVPPTDTATAMPIVLRTKNLDWDGQAIGLDAELRSIQSERVKHGMDKSKIVKGAIIGAIGGLFSRRGAKGVAEGAAAGGAVGTAVAAVTRDYDVCIPANSLIVLRLNSGLRKAE